MTAKRILLTRTGPDGEDSVQRLEQMGFEVIWRPALSSRAISVDAAQLPGRCHLIFTSRNGVRFAPLGALRKADHVFCVGQATAEAAKLAGYQTIHSANGNSKDLIRLIGEYKHLPPYPLIHLANDKPRGDIVASLTNVGLNTRLVQVYETNPAPDFAPTANAVLTDTNNPCHALLVYSPAAAGILADQCSDAICAFIAQNGFFVTISEAAAAPLADFADIRLKIAAKPTEDALFRALTTG